MTYTEPPSESLIARTWNLSHECLALLNRDGFFIHTNAQWRKHIALPVSGVPSLFLDCVDSPQQDLVEHVWHAVQQTGQPAMFECKFKISEHHVHWFECRIKPMPETDLLYVAAQPIAQPSNPVDLPKAEQLALLPAILAYSQLGFVCFDRQYRYAFLNEDLAKINGLSVEEHLHQPIQAVLPIADKVIPILDEVFRTGQPLLNLQVHGSTLASQDPDRIWLCHFYPVIVDSEVKYVGATIREVTYDQRQEEALLQALKAAEEANRAKMVILNNMSHEIRTPLTNMIGYASLLARKLEGRQKLQADRITESGQRLSVTLNAVLLLAHLEADTYRTRLTLGSFGSCIANVLQPLGQQAQERGLTWELQIAPEVDELEVEFDYEALKSIVQHVASNAIKFTSAGGVQIKAQVLQATQTVELIITDTGIGIDEIFLKHLFEPFQQESSGLNRRYEGSGLGLAVTQRLITILGGSINIQSSKGQGTTVTLTFPLQKAVSRPAILVVEDTPETADIIAETLEELGQVYIATNAPEALQVVNEYKKNHRRAFDIVLLDIQLGQSGSGIDVLKQLRQMPAYAHVPAIAVTAHAFPDERIALLQAGFNDHLAKPFAPDKLEALVTNYLAEHIT